MAKGYQFIQAQTLTSTAATVTFSNIPQNFTELVFYISARSDRTGQIATINLIRFNGDSGSNYPIKSLVGNGSTVSSSGSTGTAIWDNSLPCANTTTNVFGNTTLHILNYTSSSNKSVSVDAVTENNATETYISPVSGIWNSSAAVTSVSFTANVSNFIAGSTFTLYGIGGTRATGGTITSDKDFTYHTFTSTGTFTALEKIKGAEVLLVAGGGGGGAGRWGNNNAGGGGAGGLVNPRLSSLIAGTSYAAVVGAGGASMANGSSSQFTSTTAVGGGTGGGYAGPYNGATGGSGGGAANFQGTETAGAGTSGQGFAGGSNTSVTDPYHAAGGGGAGGVGANASPGSGAGGLGTSAYTSWNYATNTGVSSNGIYFIAAGGGGGSNGTSASSTNSIGGRGGSSGNGVGTAGTINTGSGGGGGAGGSGSGQGTAGGAGGSGLVIIRYPNY